MHIRGPGNHACTAQTRRSFLQDSGVGLGKIALASLLTGALDAAQPASAATGEPADALSPRPAHFAPRAKAVIYLFMAGAPSHLDLFDYKPQLARSRGSRSRPR